jgi:hypothetical protein
MIKTYLGGLKKRVESIISKVHNQGITTILSSMKLGLNLKHLNDVEMNNFFLYHLTTDLFKDILRSPFNYIN